jgi:hypothetical protein
MTAQISALGPPKIKLLPADAIKSVSIITLSFQPSRKKCYNGMYRPDPSPFDFPMMVKSVFPSFTEIRRESGWRQCCESTCTQSGKAFLGLSLQGAARTNAAA